MIRLFHFKLLPYRQQDQLQVAKQGWSQLRNEEETAKLVAAWSARDQLFLCGSLGGKDVFFFFGGVCRSSELGHVGYTPTKKAAELAFFLEPRLFRKGNGGRTFTLIFQMQALFVGEG